MYIMFAHGNVIEYERAEDYDLIRAKAYKTYKRNHPSINNNYLQPVFVRAEVKGKTVNLIEI